MAIGEQEFIIKARDELTATMRQLQSSVDAFGEKTKTQFEKATKGGQGFSAWMRGERTNQRQQNFLFSQMREVVGGAALTLSLFGNTAGQSDAQMKRLTSGLNSGFLAFQGVEFALGTINPVLGLVAGGVAGLSVLWRELNNDMAAVESQTNAMMMVEKAMADATVENAAAIDEYLKMLLKLKRERAIAEDIAAYEQQRGAVVALTNMFGGLVTVVDKYLVKLGVLKSNPVTTGVQGQVTIIPGVTTTDANPEDARKKATESLIGAYTRLIAEQDANNARLAAAFPLQAGINAAITERLALARKIGDEEYTALRRRERELEISKQSRAELQQVSVTRPTSFDQQFKGFDVETLTALQGNFAMLGVTAENVAGAISSTMSSAAATIVDVMFGATARIGEMFENLARTIAQMFIEQALKVAVTSFITDVLGFTGFGGTAPALAGIPAEIESPSGSTGGGSVKGGGGYKTININVNGKPIVASPRDRRGVADALIDAIFTEKIAWS